ncbi:MAG: LytTR family DNA-binding domain-containing protein [Myxococcota bacterium]
MVDDEEPARRRLVRMLDNLLPKATIGQAEDTDEAERKLDEESFDLVLMDISIPGESGMELFLRRSDLPPVIFVTAHSEHAVEAFEVSAIDYLVKPVSSERMNKALQRLGSTTRRHTPNDATRTTVTARRAGMIQIFTVDTISRFWSSSKYTVFEHGGLEYLLDDSLNQLQERFTQFIRVHRSELVNSTFVQAVDRRGGGASVHLRTGEVVNVSRRYMKALLDRLGIR